MSEHEQSEHQRHAPREVEFHLTLSEYALADPAHRGLESD